MDTAGSQAPIIISNWVMWFVGFIMAGVAGAIAHLYKSKADRSELQGIRDLRDDMRELRSAIMSKAFKNSDEARY